MQKPNAQNPHRHGDDRRWVINSLIPRALFRTRKNRKSISAIQYIHIYTIPKRISLSYDRRTIKHILWLNRMWDHRHFSTYVFIGFLCFGNTGCEREIREPKARAQGRRGWHDDRIIGLNTPSNTQTQRWRRWDFKLTAWHMAARYPKVQL